jgi:large subunit ribosomal protein L23
MPNIYSVIKKPIVNEKSSLLLKQNKVLFEVDPRATKHRIKEAVMLIFNIKAISIKVINTHGKVKRIGRKFGKRKSIKKAIVTVSKEIDINEYLMRGKKV